MVAASKPPLLASSLKNGIAVEKARILKIPREGRSVAIWSRPWLRKQKCRDPNIWIVRCILVGEFTTEAGFSSHINARFVNP